MSEKMTRIRLPGTKWVGLMEWGEWSTENMVVQAREYAEYQNRQAALVLNASPEDFQIDVVRGPIVQHHVREVQKARLK